jgi:pyruvate,water dikinase
MSGPLQLLRAAGVLAEHNARQQTITTEMFTDLEPLRAMTVQNGQIRAALDKGELPADPDFRRRWVAYLDKHGHRGVYESDIARPRLHEAPEAVLMSLSQPTNRRQPLPPRTLLGRLTLPIWWQASRNMQTREALRCNAIIGFDRLVYRPSPTSRALRALSKPGTRLYYGLEAVWPSGSKNLIT